jgi:tripartite-type tricarboxylate transporter receptor subunit TctC
MTVHGHWLRIGLFCLLSPVLIPTPAPAQNYPAGPVRIITQQGAGGGTDVAMRMVTEALGKLWGQQAVLINQPGAGGALAARTVAEAQPDGHTLFLALASAFVVLPETQRNLSFNVNDFVPVGFVGEAPMAIAVSPTLPVSNISELVALSKTQSGGLNAAVAFRGGMPHLATELFASRSGAALSSVHYPSSAQSLSDVVSGRVQVSRVSADRWAADRSRCSPWRRAIVWRRALIFQPSPRPCPDLPPRAGTCWWRRVARRPRSSTR